MGKMIRTLLGWGFLSFLLAMSGCSTRHAADSPGGIGWPVEEPQVDLTQYRDVQSRPGQNAAVAVCVAISGGGHRAANFAAGVFLGLENCGPANHPYNLLKEVDYFSTVSGGGFAAGAYVSSLLDYQENGGQAQDFRFGEALAGTGPRGMVNPRVKRDLEVGYHNWLARGVFAIKALGNLDRGDFLERALDDKVLGRSYAERRGKRSLVMGEMFIPVDAASDRQVRLPLWIPNSTVYENGAVFPFTPDILSQYGITGCTHRLGELQFDGAGSSAARYAAFPLSVGMKSSAAFPGAIPATTLKSSRDPRNPYLHLFDGGMSDNLGILTAIRILSAQPTNTVKKKLLIVVDAYPGTHEPFSKTSGSPRIRQILTRSTGISLDSSHQRLGDMLRRMGESEGIRVVVIGFASLLKRPGEFDQLFATVRGVRTTLNVSLEVQNLLVQAGREAVMASQDSLNAAIQDLMGVH